MSAAWSAGGPPHLTWEHALGKCGVLPSTQPVSPKDKAFLTAGPVRLKGRGSVLTGHRLQVTDETFGAKACNSGK